MCVCVTERGLHVWFGVWKDVYRGEVCVCVCVCVYVCAFETLPVKEGGRGCVHCTFESVKTRYCLLFLPWRRLFVSDALYRELN